jgi:hypothetical protein
MKRVKTEDQRGIWDGEHNRNNTEANKANTEANTEANKIATVNFSYTLQVPNNYLKLTY